MNFAGPIPISRPKHPAVIGASGRSRLFLSSQLVLLLTTCTTASSGTEGQPDGRIINGTAVTPPHKYPWTVATYYAGCFSDGFCPHPAQGCGASIVNEYFVLTAAHCCFLDPSDKVNKTIKGMFVLTGLYIREKLEPWSQNLSVADCIVHELYEHESQLNDIALLRVNGKMEFGDKVTPVNLPSPSLDVEELTQAATIATVVGWGNTKPTGMPVRAKELQEVALPLVTTDTCQRAFSLVNFFGTNTSFIVTENMLCMGFTGGGASQCTGDSGGPVMVLNPLIQTHTQVGVVSWSSKPCGSGLGVSTRLSKYVHWIHHHLQKCKPRTLL